MAVRSGVDFPFLVYQWASGEPIDQVDRYRTGGWMRYLRGDLSATAATIRQRGRPGIPSPARAVLDFGASFLRPMGYDYLDWQDLLPAARATADFTRSTLGKMLGREPTSLRRQSRELREGDEDAATVRARRAV